MRVAAYCVMTITVAFSAATACWCHDIKVLASRMTLPKTPGKSTVYLAWGHRLPVDDLVESSTIDRFEMVAADGKASSLKHADASLQANVVSIEQDGTHQAAIVRKASVYTYVFDEDGNRIFKRGPKTGIKSGKIDKATRSQQFGKAIIAAGKPLEEAPKPLGHALEIVPASGPAAWKTNAPLRLNVLFGGKPLANAEVVARYVGYRPDDAWNETLKTDANGQTSFQPTHPGLWVIRTQMERPAEAKDREAIDVEAYTATLSLDVQP
ncbi:MAG: DUF4198 domain-containing protein [Gemmataceae bacterium]